MDAELLELKDKKTENKYIIYYSCLRPIDTLKLRLLFLIRDQLN